MSKITEYVIRHKRSLLILFILLSAFSLVVIPTVNVNYNMVEYLPSEAQSTIAIEIIQSEFGSDLPNALVMMKGYSIQESLLQKKNLMAISGVTSVLWLDDVVGKETLSSIPITYLDQSIIETYYKNDTSLFTLTIENGKEKDTVAAIRNIIGEGNAVTGEAVNTAMAQTMAYTEVIKAMAILIPIIILILLLTSTMWLEPLLFLAAVGVAVLINMGTNILFGEISFMTQAISPILQLAVSLDYAIFLLHSFNELRQDHPPEEAMALAMKKAVTAVASSAATTVAGFLALLFMRFEIGADLGINLVKGVIISFISVMIFLPTLTLACYKLLDKSRHKSIVPGFGRAGKVIIKIGVVFMILAVLIAVPTFLAQSNLEFQYGLVTAPGASRASKDEAAIRNVFGNENTLVLLVPNGNAGKESDLCKALNNIRGVTAVVSYVTAVGAEIPKDYLSPEITKLFYSENFARILVYSDMNSEGTDTFNTIELILDTTDGFYETGSYYMAGQSASLYDMRAVVSSDTLTVNIAAIIGIFLILLIAFKSPVLPLLLVFTIESAIWLNLSLAYFAGQSFNFIGYLVLSTVQLGATVDYAILMTDRYRENRKVLTKKEAIQKAITDNLIVILTSAAILSTAGFTLASTSSNIIISQLGLLLGRGTLLSLLTVTLVLPALLVLFDGLVQKTTLRFKKPQ